MRKEAIAHELADELVLAQSPTTPKIHMDHLPSLMERSTEPSVNSDFVAQQIRVVAAVTTAVYGVTRLLRIMRVPEAGTVTAGLGILGFIYASVRLTASSLQRLGLTASRRRQAQAELRGDLRALRERVQVMVDLVESGLRLHRLHPAQQAQIYLQEQQQQQQQQRQQERQSFSPPESAGLPTAVQSSTWAVTGTEDSSWW
ncbi:hypothetical protein Vretimale_2772 [Volvox reticuliferus]|uniref:Uncharacterized protein n=1 Tax=Volvox reticuliferus TaxID=1737510 RepID=A0A8J4FK26_9CHLO|nr:hypothetical protein Vretifemale_6870 [Volvox reticuliferus]GIL97287.1 hypothetical protein Vretimale_2772 [Volvox reticuliferus]